MGVAGGGAVPGTLAALGGGEKAHATGASERRRRTGWLNAPGAMNELLFALTFGMAKLLAVEGK